MTEYGRDLGIGIAASLAITLVILGVSAAIWHASLKDSEIDIECVKSGGSVNEPQFPPRPRCEQVCK